MYPCRDPVLLNPLKLKLYLSLVLDGVLSEGFSFEKAVVNVVRKYGLKSSEAEHLYKLSYRVLIYYHSIKFLASLKGFKPTPVQLAEFLHQKNYDLKSIIDELDDTTKHLTPSARIALLHGYPPWFVSDLYGRIRVEELEAMLRSLNTRKRWLVVNTSKITIEEAVSCLEKHGVEVRGHERFPEVLQVKDPFRKIGNIPCVIRGEVVPEDVSSYIVLRLLELGGEDFVDACSAPGLKLSQLLARRVYSRAIAVDLSESRVGVIPKMVKRLAGTRPELVIINGDSRTLVFNTRRAIVLIDAPCSNSGSVYSNPTVKVYLSKYLVKKASRIQLALLKNATRYAERVFYVVCSIHPREGEEVVSRLLNSTSEFKLVQPTMPYGAQGYAGYQVSANVARLYPHVVEGQGFFIAVLERTR